MIRVCYLVDADFLGGAEHYVAHLALALDRAAFEPVVVMRAGRDEGLVAWADALAARGVPVHRVPMDLPLRAWHAVAILRLLERLAPHVAHVNMPGPYSGQNGLLVPLSRLCGARTVVTEHLPMVPPTPRRSLLKRAAYPWLDLAVTVSAANARFLCDYQRVPRARVRVVRNGIAPAPPPLDRAAVRAEAGAGPGDVLIWFVGNILEHKGLYALIEALSSSRAPWRLAVVGTGPDRGRVEALAAASGAAARVVFMGRRAHGWVRAALPAGDLLALPSRWEGLPYVILEAMAAGLPVVSSAVFGIPEAVVDGETGLLTAPGDIPALGRALDALLGDAALRARMGEAARARYQAHFTLEREVAATCAVYRELCAGRGPA